MEPNTNHVHHLQDVLHHIQSVLERQQLIRSLVDRTQMAHHDLVQDLVARQHLATLESELHRMHPADIAYVLENLPQGERSTLWKLIQAKRRGSVLLELAGPVRTALMNEMEGTELLGATRHLDSDEIADLVAEMPSEMVPEILQNLDRRNLTQVQTALSFPEDTVGALMDFDLAAVREDVSLDVVLRWLRRRGKLPEGVDTLPVVTRQGELCGELPLQRLLFSEGDQLVSQVMEHKALAFHTNDPIDEAAAAFERYDLISAPVLNVHNRLLGTLKVDAVLEYLHDSSQRDVLSQAGLRKEEDLFAPVYQSARNRGLWLALNLVIAFIASRVIGQFEDTIGRFVALAALMPIVAAVGGNTGNQTLAVMIRGYALNQVNVTNFSRLLSKEAVIGLLNGLAWGGAMALITLLIYANPMLAAVMLAAMVVTMTFAAVAGALTPALLRHFGYDPAYGSAIIVTGITDSLGFFVFLGLASALLGN